MVRRSRISKRPAPQYRPRKHYTSEELLDAEIDDLEIDLRGAVRDGLLDYARKIEERLSIKLEQRGNRPSTIPAYAPEPVSAEPMIGWRYDNRGRRIYVRERPGDDGVDWGWVDKYSQARPLSPEWQARFRDDMNAIGDEWGFDPVYDHE
jgi:hypothetical protein